MSLGLIAAMGAIVVGEPPRTDLVVGAEAAACARRHGADSEVCRTRPNRVCEDFLIFRRCDPADAPRRRGR